METTTTQEATEARELKADIGFIFQDTKNHADRYLKVQVLRDGNEVKISTNTEIWSHQIEGIMKLSKTHGFDKYYIKRSGTGLKIHFVK